MSGRQHTASAILGQPSRFSLRPRLARRVFAFDLDGTITACEILPRIAALAGLEHELRILTQRTLRGEIPFETSFRRRFAMLRHLPLDQVQATVSAVPLDPHIEAFIAAHRSECVIVTGNLDIWIQPLLRRLGCRWFASRGAVIGGALSLLSVLDKGDAARALLAEGASVIAIGDSVNDAPLFRSASLSVVFGGVHEPPERVRRIAGRYAADGESLCRLLEELRS